VSYPRLASFRTPAALRAHLAAQGIRLALDDAPPSPGTAALARRFEHDGVAVGNRFCILPMEGWDGTADGAPSELTRRRWRGFGASGAKLIWGGEAVAVRQDGRANPNQLLITEANLPALAALREELVSVHRERFGGGAEADLFVGLQLTHSGRYARPSAAGPAPLVAYAHPLLDRRFPGGTRLLDDADLERLVADFVAAGVRAQRAGFRFVDLKHCHGYLGHELLSARSRTGRYGGSFENRTRFLREVAAGLRAEAPGLRLAVRVSVFDVVPHTKGPGGVGRPEAEARDYACAFGRLDPAATPMSEALADARELLALLEELGIRWVCVTAGSPYYNPHVQRPALFPPSDGYLPPEDPLAGVARQIEATALLKAAFPGLAVVGSAYTYLQEYLPHVAERVIREGGADFVGLGRMALSYPELPADVLAGRPLRRKLVCRTFSDCTSAPRNGLVSGCYPLDPFYAAHPDAARLAAFKAAARPGPPNAQETP
jgi:2,4-dienoyl-CoA reductase-like NADH-dependent reductase (Old Yellow Enzyme family)